MVNYGKIRLARYEFKITPEEELELPSFKGSTLRGGFGSIFRKISCTARKDIPCKKCILKEKCPYSYVFETSPAPDSLFLKNLEDIPRPFIIEPPLDSRTLIKKNENLIFNLVLIGQAINYFPYFVVAFKELGKKGIGRGRRRFILKEIRAVSLLDEKNEIVYDSSNDMIRNIQFIFSWADVISISRKRFAATGTKTAAINFLTPTRVKYRDEFVSLPEFHVIFRSLLRRIANLAYFHCGECLGLDFNHLIGNSEKIKIERINVHWVDWERYSFAQDSKMKMGGFVGEVKYRGDLESYLPFLLLGEHIHIGKGATFGMGWYRLMFQ